MKKMYVSEIEGPKRSGRPVVRRKNKVKEYMLDRGDILNKQGGRGGGPAAMVNPFGNISEGNEASETI